MNIVELLKSKTTLSFEVFPPKMDKPLEPLLEILGKLYGLAPDFISVTYGAGGTNAGRAGAICQSILRSGHTVLSHLTCIGQDTAEIDGFIDEFAEAGGSNLLLLRGDLPEGWTGTGGTYTNATELIRYVAGAHPGMTLAGSAYPETHLECTPEEGIRIMREKEELGVSFFMTQLCYDVDAYSRLLDSATAAGIKSPIVIGVMPVLKADATIKMAVTNGCSIPADLARVIGKWGDDPDCYRQAGKEYTARLIDRYRAAGAPGIHLYTLNKYEDIADLVLAM